MNYLLDLYLQFCVQRRMECESYLESYHDFSKGKYRNESWEWLIPSHLSIYLNKIFISVHQMNNTLHHLKLLYKTHCHWQLWIFHRSTCSDVLNLMNYFIFTVLYIKYLPEQCETWWKKDRIHPSFEQFEWK